MFEITENVKVLDYIPSLQDNKKGMIIIRSNLLPSLLFYSHLINWSHIECELSYKQIVPAISFKGFF
jgi:hypothetical protein